MSAVANDAGPLLERVMKSGEFSDLTFVSNGNEFFVHKNIVCQQSAVIKAAIQGGFEESITDVIKMDDFEARVVRCMVQFLYTGKYEVKDVTTIMQSLPPGSVLGMAYSLSIEICGDTEMSSDSESESAEESGGFDTAMTDTTPPFDGQVEPSSLPMSSFIVAGDVLLEHIRVNSIGDYYGLDGLVALSNKKIKKMVLDGKPSPGIVSCLPFAVATAIGSTGDQEVAKILATAIDKHLVRITSWMEYEVNGAMTPFAIDVLQKCATTRQTLKAKHKETKRQFRAQVRGLEVDIQDKDDQMLDKDLEIQAKDKTIRDRDAEIQRLDKKIIDKEFELSRALQCLRKLNTLSECRNCETEFKCSVDETEWLVRCRDCRCRHT